MSSSQYIPIDALAKGDVNLDQSSAFKGISNFFSAGENKLEKVSESLANRMVIDALNAALNESPTGVSLEGLVGQVGLNPNVVFGVLVNLQKQNRIKFVKSENSTPEDISSLYIVVS